MPMFFYDERSLDNYTTSQKDHKKGEVKEPKGKPYYADAAFWLRLMNYRQNKE